ALAQMNVTNVNDAPVLTPGNPVLGGIDENAINNAGQTVGSFVSGISDVDSGALSGIAITGLSSTAGTWQFSLDGITWYNMGTLSASSALLLRTTDKVRLQPDGSGGGSATLTYKAWDQSGSSNGMQGVKADTSSSGGSSAFSAASDTASLTITGVNQAPVVSTSGGSAAFVAGDNTVSTPVVVDSGLTLSDRDNTSLDHATVSITGNFHAGQDILSFSNTSTTLFGNITSVFNMSTGVLSLSGTATVAQWQAALEAVTFTNTAITPITATRTISFVANDGQLDSAVATRTVTVTATAQTPIVGTSGGSAEFVENGAISVDSGLTICDLDSTTLVYAKVKITGNFAAGEDILMFVINPATMGNISATYNAATGELVLTASGPGATLAQWQAALRSVGYQNGSDNPSTATRTVSF
ncbi:MAG: hypothetical protein ACRER5_10175, partial [Pseudomonas sp.]